MGVSCPVLFTAVLFLGLLLVYWQYKYPDTDNELAYFSRSEDCLNSHVLRTRLGHFSRSEDCPNSHVFRTQLDPFLKVRRLSEQTCIVNLMWPIFQGHMACAQSVNHCDSTNSLSVSVSKVVKDTWKSSLVPRNARTKLLQAAWSRVNVRAVTPAVWEAAWAVSRQESWKPHRPGWVWPVCGCAHLCICV